MSSISISLSESMKAFIEQQVATGGYSSPSEYLQELISQAQKHKEQEVLEELLIEGLESGELIEVTDEWWQQKQAHLIDKLRQGK